VAVLLELGPKPSEIGELRNGFQPIPQTMNRRIASPEHSAMSWFMNHSGPYSPLTSQ